MKRFLIALLAVIMILSIFACGKEASGHPEKQAEPTEVPAAEPTEAPTEEPEPTWPDTLIDLWTVISMEMDGATLNPADVGMKGTFDFSADGTVLIEMSGSETVDPYTVSGRDVTIADGETEIVGTYDPAADSLTMEADGVKLVLVRDTAVEKLPEADLVQMTEITDPEFAVGTWSLAEGRIGSSVFPAEMLDIVMTLTFDGSGSVSVTTEEAPKLYRWELQDGRIEIMDGDTVLFTLTSDGARLFLEEPDSRVLFAFDRQD